MSDFGELSKPEEQILPSSSELSLSHEQMDKMSSDLVTLSKLRSCAHENGYTFALTGGYAVDAIDGGKISRFHADMDGVFFVPPTVPYETVTKALGEQLLVEETPWELVKDEEGSLEYREADERKEWEMRRRLELDIFEPSLNTKTMTKTLVDLEGKSQDFDVLSVEDLLAAKVLSMVRLADMTQEEREAAGLRDMKVSDKADFHRLLKSPEFNEQATIGSLAGAIRYISEDQISPEEAGNEALSQWQKAMSIINSEEYV